MRRKCKTFEEWCHSQAKEFGAICEKAQHLGASCYSNQFNSSLKCHIINERTGRSGFSSVKIDNFNDPTTIAIALAWADYKGEIIPSFTEALGTLYARDENLFRYQGYEWQVVQRHPYNSNEFICACENGQVKTFTAYALVYRIE